MFNVNVLVTPKQRETSSYIKQVVFLINVKSMNKNDLDKFLSKSLAVPFSNKSLVFMQDVKSPHHRTTSQALVGKSSVAFVKKKT